MKEEIIRNAQPMQHIRLQTCYSDTTYLVLIEDVLGQDGDLLPGEASRLPELGVQSRGDLADHDGLAATPHLGE